MDTICLVVRFDSEVVDVGEEGPNVDGDSGFAYHWNKGSGGADSG